MRYVNHSVGFRPGRQARASSASISARVGIEGAVPGRVTEMPAVASPKRTASRGAAPPASAAAKPPLKASPAPVVSTTVPAPERPTIRSAAA